MYFYSAMDSFGRSIEGMDSTSIGFILDEAYSQVEWQPGINRSNKSKLVPETNSMEKTLGKQELQEQTETREPKTCNNLT